MMGVYLSALLFITPHYAFLLLVCDDRPREAACFNTRSCFFDVVGSSGLQPTICMFALLIDFW